MNLPLRRANAHDAIRLIFAKPRFLRLAQNSFADVVEEMSNDDQSEGDRVEPVDVQVEDMEPNKHSLPDVSTKIRRMPCFVGT